MKKFILIICLSLMGFSIASQISFNSGMLSEILKFRIDFDKRSMALEDSENMLVQPEGPIFRRTGTEFIDEALTEFSYTVTDTNDSNDPNTPIYGDYTEYVMTVFLGGDSVHFISKYNTNGELVTSWGDNGYWDGEVSGGVSYDVAQLNDGRLLVAHQYNTVTMINTDGTTDTTWATNGSYVHPNNYQFYKILVDDDDNIHLFSVGGYTYIKLDSDGNYLGGINSGIINFEDAAWENSDKTRILAVGESGYIYPPVGLGYLVNIVAINPETMAIDTTWSGNIEHEGYALTSLEGTIYSIKVFADSSFVTYNGGTTGNVLSKFLPTGSGIDTSWGSSGVLDIGFFNASTSPNIMENDGYELYTISYLSDPSRVVFSHIDSNGLVDDFYTAEVANGAYYGIKIINDKLVLLRGNSPVNDVEIWSKTFEYESGFDNGSVQTRCVIPDESTREVTYTGGGDGETTTTTTVTTLSRDKTRLIPFTYSNTDNYVLEFGHNFVGFLR